MPYRVKIALDHSRPSAARADALCVFATESPVRVYSVDGLSPDLVLAIKRAARDGCAKDGKVTSIDTLAKIRATRIVIAGLGKKSKINADTLRNAAGRAAQKAQSLEAHKIAITVPRGISFSDAETAAQLVEGARLALYKFDRSAKAETPSVSSIGILHHTPAVAAAVKSAATIADSVVFARDLANMPPNECTPETLARTARTLGRNVSCRIMAKSELARRGFGGIIAVGSASYNEPRLIVTEYKGAPRSKRPVLLVGKAVTFDTGGISLKPGERMDEMKFDKCGGCAVLGIMRAVSRLGIRDNVVGIVPAVENMPGGGAYRPGDIVKLYSKKTAEILNTDAEGRLILADALSYGETTYRPRAIIDMATLTGACIVALGASTAGLVSTSDRLAESLESASAKTAERVWRLPIDDDYMAMIDSKIADMKNMGIGRTAGTITAAAFLRNAVSGTPWAHIDIAGPAWTQTGTVERSYNPGGATGFGVRLVTNFLAG